MTKEKTCPSCYEIVHPKASKCPHCQSKITRFSDVMIARIAVTFWGSLAVACVHYVGNAPPHSDVDRNGTVVDEARSLRIIDCQLAIKRDLDDPDSADFPNFLEDMSAYTAHPDDNPADPPGFTIEDFVFHAKNRMGGVQRFGGECTYDQNGKLILASAS